MDGKNTIINALTIIWRKIAVNRIGRIISLYSLLFLIFFHGKIPNNSPINLPEPPIQKHAENSGNSYFRWYMTSEDMRNTSFSLSLPNHPQEVRKIWPENHGVSDRIENQLLYSKYGVDGKIKKIKLILLAGTKVKSKKRLPIGKAHFYKTRCPVTSCRLTYEVERALEADAIVFKDHVNGELVEGGYKRPVNQLWILSLLEPPNYSSDFAAYKDSINWTSTYRHDSELVTPYEKFVLYDQKIKQKKQSENFAAGKRNPGRIAWFVSNCETPNNRMQWAQELGKHFPLDIYGKCGPHKCDLNRMEKCLSIIQRDYKFYLAFENTNCRWYITEKLWTGLRSAVIPIVMGAPVSDYEAVAPHGSFIHVDNYAHPKQLAEYLHYLDNNDTAYNEYFQWMGTGELINTQSLCRLCTLLHSDYPILNYGDVQNWWQMGGTVCSNMKNNFTCNLHYNETCN